MEIIFLGTNGWYDTKTGNTTCTLIETEDYFIILDAGNGLYKIDQYITSTSKRPIYLFLSHFHLDHIVGLHIMSKFNCNYSPLGSPHHTTRHSGGRIELRPDHFDKSLSFLLCCFVGA